MNIHSARFGSSVSYFAQTTRGKGRPIDPAPSDGVPSADKLARPPLAFEPGDESEQTHKYWEDLINRAN